MDINSDKKVELPFMAGEKRWKHYLGRPQLHLVWVLVRTVKLKCLRCATATSIPLAEGHIYFKNKEK